MKRYRGIRTRGDAKVYRSIPGEPLEDSGSWVKLTHHVRHSPDGHEWGYSGSGPSELARDLLWDLTGKEPPGRVYTAFRDAVIATLRTERWEFSEEKLRFYLSLCPQAPKDARWCPEPNCGRLIDPMTIHDWCPEHGARCSGYKDCGLKVVPGQTECDIHLAAKEHRKPA